MSLNIGPSDASQSFNNSRHHYSKARHTIWTFLMAPFKTKRDAVSQPNPPINNHPNASITTTIDDLVLSKLSKDLIFMEENLAKVTNYVNHVNKQISHFREKIEELKTTAVSSSNSKTELDILKKSMAKLKSQIPSNLKIHLDDSHPHQNPWWDSNQAYVNEAPDHELRNKKFELDTAAAAEFEEFFLGLPLEQKQGLFSLLKFPENAIIKKRLIIYWWIGVGIIAAGNLSHSETEEDFANRFFDYLVKRCFIEPVSEKRSSSVVVVDSCRIHPLIRSALTIFAERDGFTNINGDYYYFLSQPNFGSATLYDDPQLLSNMKNAKILHLGQWQQQSSTHHIEVANIKFFDGLKNMKHHLTFLSLRGISLITELPSIICELTNLEILDLKSCHNLESLPKGIGLLHKLTHLDMSECYFLEHMPKSLASLLKLQVLKGFFIGETDNNKSSSSSSSSSSCTLGDLARLPFLRKLNIYTNVKDFPSENDLSDLNNYFSSLQKLTISWGGCSLLGADDDEIAAVGWSIRFLWDPILSKLRKLDLHCFPGTMVPIWQPEVEYPGSFKKLYIRGGRICTLPYFNTVEILRLKYLNELEMMSWSRLLELFPNLNYFEKVDCPNLVGFPCDESGVWRKGESSEEGS